MILRIILGWYFGKTAGLLGTLDNEPNNDMMMPSGEMAWDQTSFTNSWMIDSGDEKCISHLPAQRKQINPNQEVTCDSFFASKASQFSSCFPVVSSTVHGVRLVQQKEAQKNSDQKGQNAYHVYYKIIR